MSFLNGRQKNTLAMICDTLIPALQAESGEDERLYNLSAADLNLAQLLEEALENVTDAKAQGQLKQFFGLLENPLVNGLTTGQWGAFSHLTLAQRTRILQSWATSRLMLARQAFQGVKRLALFLFYATMPDGKPNPTWQVYNYGGPPPPYNGASRPIQPLIIDKPTTLNTDVLVVGSGAGGGVVAGELSAAGLDVIVVEKGGYYADNDFHGKELESNADLFENSGALTTADVSMVNLAGSTLGGGTTINWMTSLRPPDYVRTEWASKYGFSAATGPDFDESLDAVSQRINVNTNESQLNRQHIVLEQGCKALGYDLKVIPRNAKGCQECGFCGFGCPYGAKQSTLNTYLQDAHERGTRILVRAHVDRVFHQNGVASGAVATVQNNGRVHRVSIKARVIVISAGAIHSPAILRRSGLSNPNIGSNLHLHPVTPSFATYDEPVESWQGRLQTRVLDKFANLDGQGYGIRIEVAPSHPGLLASAVPWQSGPQHKHIMQNLRHIANNIVITRDLHTGQIKLDKQGQPVLHYTVHPYDQKHMMHGLLEALKIHRAAGAREISAPHSTYLVYRYGDGSIDDFLDRVRAEGFRGNAYALFSAHQMSTCRIAGDSKRGALKPTGETYEVGNLFVADGSVFPSASGVNPMLTIMGLSHYIAQHVKNQLT